MLSLIPWFRKLKPAGVPQGVRPRGGEQRAASACGKAFDQLLSDLYEVDRERIDVRCYGGWAELRQLLADLDRPRQRTVQSVLLVIDRPYHGDWSRLIARHYPGLQLIITPVGTSLSGSLSPADLAMNCSSLGWLQIAVERDLSAAALGAQRSLDSGDRLTLFWPV